ncbi:MAG: XdhC family protein [Gemmatimonadota bacterium]|nr:MAG: XdhC family protein [Gemmatimonadota bacterium]
MSEKAAEVSAAEAAAWALEAQQGGEPVALATVVSAPGRQAVGRRLVVSGASLHGTLGGPELDERVAALAREMLAVRERGVREMEGPGGKWEIYIEPQHAIPELLIVGAGHIARPLCRLGAMLGFRVTVLDDRPEFATKEHFPEAERVGVIDFGDPFARLAIGPDSYVVLVTRGHKYDYDCIQHLLKMDARPAYLGMIGSRRRVRATFEALVGDGIEPARLEDVHAPIGLDIGAETPEEIALAIAGEIVATRRSGAGGRLSDEERVLDRVARSSRPEGD